MNKIISPLVLLFAASTFPLIVNASEYVCTIKTTSRLNNNGYFVKHGWAANYMNRQFTVDSQTGRVLHTTALKQRLSNANDRYQPVLLNEGNEDVPLKIFTHFKDSGRYALLQIHNNSEYAGTEKKPFFYHTDIGMILAGTCVESE